MMEESGTGFESGSGKIMTDPEQVVPLTYGSYGPGSTTLVKSPNFI
jgi:hypothetical protein